MISGKALRRFLWMAAVVACAVGAARGAWRLWGTFRSPATAAGVSPSLVNREPVAASPVSGTEAPLVSRDGAIRFSNVSSSTGVQFKHHDGGSGHKYLIEPATGGVALFDYDHDGRIDIYFVSGTPLPPAPRRPGIRNALYRNEGNWRFRDVTDQAGVPGTGFALGVTVGDYDNDGDADLFVNNFGPDTLYRNDGDGTFSDVSTAAGATGSAGVGAGANFIDFDADSDLDLFVANYAKFDLTNNPRRSIDGNPVYPGPLDFDPFPSVLLENLGDGTFRDVSVASRIAGGFGNGMGTICFDFDQDGDTDLFVANDELGNFLWENDGHGVFSEVGIPRGFAYNLDGRPRANMGLDCADVDGDGWLDVISTTYRNELPVLYRNDHGSFEDVTRRSGDVAKAVADVKWGVGFGDFDNDGHRDLLIACGDLETEIHRWNQSTAFRVPNVLLRNAGDGTFRDISQHSGDGLAVVESSRGLGLDDLDNDGDLDFVVLNSQAPSTIVRNDTACANHWLQLELHGTGATRDAVGAQVRVTAGGRTQLAEVVSGRGYQCHFGTRMHFGLGDHNVAERVEVRWLGGGGDVWTNVQAGQRLLLLQGSSKPIRLAP